VDSIVDIAASDTALSGEAKFFAFARERYSILLKRRTGQPWPWTDDLALRKYKFTNVFREDDRTTVWFRENVRDRLRSDPSVLLATVLFRWFNRVEIGQVIFQQGLLGHPGCTPWDVFRDSGDTVPMRGAILSAFPRGPYVTGAYMLHSPAGMDKLDGILHYCRQFYHHSGWREVARNDINHHTAQCLEDCTNWLQEFDGQGPFTAYEVACDLLYTAVLERARDRMTWANLGPGARRGLNRVHGRVRVGHRKPHGAPVREEDALQEMRRLLLAAHDPDNWPSAWPMWDMRTVEHTLCEFDKWCRATSGEGEPKQLYRRTST
jgi:hypothetical protein